MNLCIAGSVRNNIPKKYIKEAEKMSNYIIENGFDIVCCLDERGIIGSIYRKIKSAGKNKLQFFVPKIYLECQKNMHEEFLGITNTINERTDALFKNSDVAIYFPGGIGTVYEILSGIETKRAGEHNCKLIIINLYGFFDELISMLEKMYDERFANLEDKKEYYIVNSIEEAIELIEKIK